MSEKNDLFPKHDFRHNIWFWMLSSRFWSSTLLTCPPACLRSAGWLCRVCCSSAALHSPTAHHVYILLPSLTCSNITTAWICFLIFAASSACLPSLWSIPSWFFKVWPIWAILASVVWEMCFREWLNCRTPNTSTLASSCGAAAFFLLVFLTGRAQAALNPPVKQSRHRLQIRFILSFTFLAFSSSECRQQSWLCGLMKIQWQSVSGQRIQPVMSVEGAQSSYIRRVDVW